MNFLVYIKKYIQLVAVFVLIFLPIMTLAQKQYVVSGEIKIENGTLKNTEISLFKNGKKKETSPVDKKGKFKYHLDFGSNYMLVFTKIGFVTKKINISTSVPPEILKADKTFPPFQLQINLLPIYMGIDISAFKQPIAKVIYDKKTNSFVFDKDYEKQIHDAITIAEDAIRKKIDNLASIENAYQEAIKQGDVFFENKEYLQSKASYQKAISLKKYKGYPKEQIVKINRILAEQAQKESYRKGLEDKYQQVVAKADALFQSKKYIEAQNIYHAATRIKQEAYPLNQLEKIGQILADQKQQSKAYGDLIKLANKQLEEKKYKEAKASYHAAIELNPKAVFPSRQIAEIDKTLLGQQKQQEELEQLTLEKKRIKEKYNAIIEEADKLFEAQQLLKAKVVYEKALKVIGDDLYAKKQITKIEIHFTSEESAKKLRKQNLKRYGILIKKADEYYKNEVYKTALSRYTMALELQPNAKHPQQRIAEINAFFEEQKKLDKLYEALIKDADGHYDQKEYIIAKLEYQKALSTKPIAEYPREMIFRIDNYCIDELHKYAESRMEDIRYNKMKILAARQIDNKKYSDAKNTYLKMQKLKPDEDYAKKHLIKIDSIFQDLKRKREEEKRLREYKRKQEAKYKMMMANGNRLFKDKLWKQALEYYYKALDLKPHDGEACSQIEKTKLEIAYVISLKKGFERKEKEYQKLIVLADKYFSEEKFAEATAIYQQALKVKKEEYPNIQLRRIAIIKVNRAKKKRLEQKIQKKYNAQLAKAEQYFKQEEFVIAKHHYYLTLAIKPGEEYPKSKIEEINKLLTISKQPDNLENPVNFTNKASIKQERMYASLLKKGDENIKLEHYTVAKVMYERALHLFDRNYPKEQLQKIAKLVKEGKAEILDEVYQKSIAKGDDAFNNREFGVAKFYYKKALAIGKREIYPQKQLENIEKEIDKEKYHEIDAAYQKAIEKADAAFHKGKKTVARFYYKKALGFKPDEKYPKEKLGELKE